MRRYLIAALTLLSLVSLPPLSYAGIVQGTLTGTAQITEVNFAYDDNAEYSVPATLTFYVDTSMQFFSFSVDNSVVPVSTQIDGPFSYSVTSNSVSASGNGVPGGYLGPTYADFSVTYQSISPNGWISPTNATATADYNGDNQGPSNSSTNISLNFESQFQSQAVPEPSSIVLAASGALMILVYVRRRSVRRRAARALSRR